MFTSEEIELLSSKKGLKKMLKQKNFDTEKILKELHYEDELEQLQIALVNLQHWVIANNKRVAILFEGRDAAGKGGTISRFVENLRPREYRVVALPKPTETERGQWYFQRYIKELPNPGEMVFFDRSWYNRAVVEPVMGFCTQKEYHLFMENVNNFEKMLHEDGIILIKFWFQLSKKEQKKRFEDRKSSPLTQWKISPVDEKAQKKWKEFSRYAEKMLQETSTGYAPWTVVHADDKRSARLESIRFLLSSIGYDDKKKEKVALDYDTTIVYPYTPDVEV